MQESSLRAGNVRFGAFALDLRSGELRKNGRTIRLPEQPCRVLAILLEHAGEVVAREELRQQLWPADTFVDFDHGLNNAIKKLRDVLDDSAENPKYVETLPKRGYRFICPVERSPAKSPSRAAWWGRPWVWVALGVFIAAALFAGNVGGLRARMFGRPAPGEIKAIAVLPLKNLSGDPQQDYVAAGITELLITEFGRFREPWVVSHQSVLQYADSKKPLPEIAGELHVDALVEGRVLREGNHFRVTINFVQAVPERHLWSESYAIGVADFTRFSSDVGRAVGGQMRVKAPLQQPSRPVNPEAYEAYLMGRYYFSRGSPDHSIKAKQYLKKAIEKDPGFARAYASLAELYSRAQYPAGKDLQASYSGAHPIAQQYALKALELDDNLAEAHTALGWVDLTEWDWAGAGREFRRAIELNPSYALAHILYADYLAAIEQRFPEATEQAKFAQRLDPASPYVSMRSADIYLFAGQLGQARECARMALELDPGRRGGYIALAQADMKEAKYAQAIAQLEKVPPGDREGFVLGNLGCAYARSGQREKALSVLRELERRAERDNVPPEAIAYVYVGLGDKDKAFACLERAYRQHRFLLYLNVKTMWEPLRSDPRFEDLVRRVGLSAANAK